MNYQFIALSSTLFFALTTILVKYISKHIVKDFDSFFFWTYVAGLPLVLLIPLKTGLDFNTNILLPILIHSILLSAGTYLFSKGIYLVDVSVISPLFQIQSGFVLILATILLREKYDPQIYSYLIFLLMGAMLVSVTDKTKIKGFFQKGVIFILGMQLLHAGANIAVGFALKYTTSWQALFYSFIFNSAIVSLYVWVRNKKITHEPKKIAWMFIRVLSLFTATGLLYKAFETNVSISAAIGLLSSPIVFLVAVLSSLFSPKLLEKQGVKTYVIRAVGMILIIFGALNIALST